ncbi:hypothetical protein BJF81_15375 [Ornithinimicrobium sp. CNJ-824]|nr:hypothetical protein BJF81_15375 [Ornithinimicrobium sp. CNJ-824]
MGGDDDVPRLPALVVSRDSSSSGRGPGPLRKAVPVATPSRAPSRPEIWATSARAASTLEPAPTTRTARSLMAPPSPALPSTARGRACSTRSVRAWSTSSSAPSAGVTDARGIVTTAEGTSCRTW